MQPPRDLGVLLLNLLARSRLGGGKKLLIPPAFDPKPKIQLETSRHSTVLARYTDIRW